MGNNRTMRNMRKGFKAPQATTNDSVDMDSTSLSWDKKMQSGQVKNQETAGKGNITNTEDAGGKEISVKNVETTEKTEVTLTKKGGGQEDKRVDIFVSLKTILYS